MTDNMSYRDYLDIFEGRKMVFKPLHEINIESTGSSCVKSQLMYDFDALVKKQPNLLISPSQELFGMVDELVKDVLPLGFTPDEHWWLGK